jgi:hypothetical protein
MSGARAGMEGTGSRRKRDARPWMLLRVAVLVAAALTSCFELAVLFTGGGSQPVPRWLELIGPVLATLYLVGLDLPTLVLSLLGSTVREGGRIGWSPGLGYAVALAAVAPLIVFASRPRLCHGSARN